MQHKHAFAFFQERGIAPRFLTDQEWIAIIEPLLAELETLRRIRHLALSYREAEIACTADFGAEPRVRRYHRALELDALLGIEEDWRGVL